MACKCQERRQALSRAARSMSIESAKKEIAFVGKSLRDDAFQLLRERHQARKLNNRQKP